MAPPGAAGSPGARPSLPRALEEPKMHVTQPDPAPRRGPSPQGPVGRPTAQLDRRPAAHSKHNGGSLPQVELKGVCVCVCVCNLEYRESTEDMVAQKCGDVPKNVGNLKK